MRAFVGGDTAAKIRAEQALVDQPDLAGPVLLRLLLVGDRTVRARASRLFAQCAPQPIAGLTELLSNPDSPVRYWAACSLGRLGPRAATAAPAVVQLLTGQPTGIRTVAAEALWKMVPLPPATLAALFAALLNPDQTAVRVREAIVSALTRVEREQPGALRSAVETLSPQIHTEALRRVDDIERYESSGAAADSERWARLTTHCS